MPRNTKTSKLVASARKVRTRNLRRIRRMLVVIMVCLAFVGGFFIRGDEGLLYALGMDFFTSDPSAGPKTEAIRDPYSSISARVGEVETIIAEDSLDSYDLDTATNTMLTSLGKATQDPYFLYYDNARYSTLLRDQSEKTGGIGVLFSEYDGKAYAVDVFEGSTAQLSGISEGDFVVAIDANRDHDWTQPEVNAAIRAHKGEDIVITWRRPANLDDKGGSEFTTTLAVSNETIANVETSLENSVGYIKLHQITQNSTNLVRMALDSLTAEGAEAFVLDIRDNPGGYLTQSVDIASLFIKSGTIVSIDTKDNTTTTKNATGSVVTDKPLVLLIDGDTSASAEVLAAALKDNQRAVLVGSSTQGKGSVQVTRELSFGGALRYTAAFYKSPLGHKIDGSGVIPDIAVGVATEGDNQKALALEVAQSRIGR